MMVNPSDPSRSLLDELLRGSESDRFERVRAVLEVVLEHPPESRMGHLLAIAGSDPPLIDTVGRLLAEIEATESAGFLAMPDECLERSVGGSASAGIACERVPEMIGVYRVIRPIGEGATGIVYEAFSPSPAERAVAIKVLRPGLSAIARARAVNEIRMQARLNHPGIAQLYDTGTMPDGRIWIATEFVNGPTITEGMKDADWEAKVRCIARVAEAVQHAHYHGVVHRDLKPSNILLKASDNDGTVPKIIDFGVATPTAMDGGANERLPITMPGMLVGTLAYMSPEQLHGRAVDARTDVFGLGLMLAELLTGALPSDRLGGMGPLLSSCARPVDVRVRTAFGRGRDLEAIIAKATEPPQHQRYATAQHFAEDLYRVLDGKPAEACRCGVLRRGSMVVARHPVFSTLGICAALALCALLVAVVVSRARLAAEVADQREVIRVTLEQALDGLSQIQGTAMYRMAIVESLLHQCEKQLRINTHDSEILGARAKLLRMRGDIEASLGDEPKAFETLNESLALFAQLRASLPHDVSLGRQYAEGMVRVGDVAFTLDRRGNLASTLELYAGAMVIQRELLSRTPNHLGLIDDITWSLDRIGDLWWIEQTVDDAKLRDWLEERIELCRQLIALDEQRLLSRYTLAMGYFRLARYARHRGEVELLASALGSGLPLIREVVERSPDRTAFVRTYTHLLAEQIELLALTGNSAAVREAILEAIDVARRHAQLMPGDSVSRGLYSLTLRHALRAALRLGETELAEEVASQAAPFIEQWNKDDDSLGQCTITALDAIMGETDRNYPRRAATNSSLTQGLARSLCVCSVGLPSRHTPAMAPQLPGDDLSGAAAH